MLIYEERGRRKERTVLLLLLFNTVSDENVIILKNVQRCFSFSKKLTICVSLKRNHFIYLVWYHLFLYRHWCTCHCFIIFLSLNDKTFFFKYCFCNFLPSQIRERKERKYGSKKITMEKQWGLTWLKVLFVLWLSAQTHPSPSSLIIDYYIPKNWIK